VCRGITKGEGTLKLIKWPVFLKAWHPMKDTHEDQQVKERGLPHLFGVRVLNEKTLGRGLFGTVLRRRPPEGKCKNETARNRGPR